MIPCPVHGPVWAKSQWIHVSLRCLCACLASPRPPLGGTLTLQGGSEDIWLSSLWTMIRNRGQHTLRAPSTQAGLETKRNIKFFTKKNHIFHFVSYFFINIQARKVTYFFIFYFLFKSHYILYLENRKMSVGVDPTNNY